MADSISIVMKMNDDISGKLKSIASTSKSVSKEFEVLQNRADALGKQYADFNQLSAKTAAEALDVKRAMDEAAKSFKKTGDEADQVRFQKLREEYTALTDAAKTYAGEAKKTQKAIRETYDQARKLEDGSEGGGGSEGFLTKTFGKTLGGALAASGVIREIGSSLTGALSIGMESAVGQPMATALNSTLSGAFSGASAGAIAGPWGAAIGALGGGIAGAISGGTQIFAQKDDAFKSYVQEAAETALSEQESAIASGTETAAQRELDAIAFDRLLGEGVGEQYLNDLRTLAAETPMEYGDLTTMSRALATGFGDAPDRMLELMTAIGDAGSAVGVTASDMTEMAQAMSRMNSSGKATLEYLNIFQDRGVDVIGMLGEALGKTQGEIYDMISRGEISGQSAADIIQQGMETRYSGSMGEMAGTYSGLTSTLQDAQTEIDAAYGEGYTKARNEGLQEQIDWLTGESGQAVEEANQAIGAWKAELENQKEQYIRDSVDAMMASEEYQAAKTAGDAAEMGRLIMQAKVQGMNEYNASEGAQEALAAEKALVDGIRDDTSLNQDYWDAGYKKGQWFTKGLASSIMGNYIKDESSPEDVSYNANVHAYGLKYVPYDNYPALLHQGERVLTAEESRRQSRSGGGGLSVTITGPVTVRQDSDIDTIVMHLADEIEARALAYGG